jgi:site-specific recombinase XerD
MLYNTGARVSEIIGVRVLDVVLEGAACVHLHGKGRKERSVPLWKSTVQALMATSNSPTYGQSNSPRQDGRIMRHWMG